MTIKPDVPMENPLEGVRVLELTQYIAGPMAGQQLADYGAEIIKIERPGGGDPFRVYDGGRNVPDYGYNFRAFNKNKKSLALDLSAPDAANVIKRIAADVDVVIENFRPGVTDRLGIGYEALKAVNPNIIYCAIAGFAADGPFAKRPAFDTIGQALSGILYLLIDPEHPTMRGPTIADQVTAMQAATGILAMLRAKERTGKGGRLDISMVDAAISFIPDVIASVTDAQKEPTAVSRVANSQAFIMRCEDDKLVAVQLGGLSKAFVDMVTALGRADLCTDERFNEAYARRQNWETFVEELRPAFAAKPSTHWATALPAVGVPLCEVLTVSEVIQQPEVVHSGLLDVRDHPVAGSMAMVRRPTLINKSRGPDQKFPPRLGEHSRTILQDLKYSAEEIEEMFARKLFS